MESDHPKTKTLQVLSDSHSTFILGFDDALLGYSEVNNNIVAVYDEDKFIELLSEELPYVEAIEFFHLNFSGNAFTLAVSNSSTPIFIRLNKNI
tara:strand:+ start:123 stop:404 length:282 start_codon:yes stop_codon:yes gene_type:complete